MLEIVGWAIKQELDAVTKMVLVVLSNHANSDGVCWPSVRRVAACAGISERHVPVVMRRLTELGYLQCRARYRGDGSNSSNEYRVIFPPSILQNEMSSLVHESDGGGTEPRGGGTPPGPPLESVIESVIEKKKKNTYGQFENVFLSEEEVNRLDTKLGFKQCDDLIQEMSEAIAAKGYKYKSHYAALLAWSRKREAPNGRRESTAEANIRTTREASARLLARLDEQVRGSVQSADTGGTASGIRRVPPGHTGDPSGEGV